MLRALIFDFDGVIIDTETTAKQSWAETYRAHGHALPDDLWATTIGTWGATFDPAEDLAARIGTALSASELAARAAREHELAEQMPILPGVIAHLDAAARRGLALGIASSSSCAWVDGLLSRLGLRERFACVLAREDVTRTKPDPELYTAALSCLGVGADEAIAFEDSPNGLLAAKAAGLRCVVIPGPLTLEADYEAADAVVGSLADVDPDELWRRLDAAARR